METTLLYLSIYSEAIKRTLIWLLTDDYLKMIFNMLQTF